MVIRRNVSCQNRLVYWRWHCSVPRYFNQGHLQKWLHPRSWSPKIWPGRVHWRVCAGQEGRLGWLYWLRSEVALLRRVAQRWKEWVWQKFLGSRRGRQYKNLYWKLQGWIQTWQRRFNDPCLDLNRWMGIWQLKWPWWDKRSWFALRWLIHK